MVVISAQVIADVLSDQTMEDLGSNYEEVQESLERMVKHAAPYTNPAGNMRYENYVFRVRCGVLLDISLEGITDNGCETCVGKGWVEVSDECPDCDGQGCRECSFDGVLPKKIQCPDCT